MKYYTEYSIDGKMHKRKLKGKDNFDVAKKLKRANEKAKIHKCIQIWG